MSCDQAVLRSRRASGWILLSKVSPIGELRKVPKKRELTVIRKFRSWLTKRILFTVVAGVVFQFEFSGT
jgi:hypothetical protein